MELVSPRGVSPAKEVAKARKLHQFGIDAINIPDGPRASARMSALAMAAIIQREVGIETVLHFACRDRNVIGMQSDLLGAWALGLRNVLAITGDPPKLGNYPDATAVFDVDAIGLTNVINRLNHGLDLAGNPIGDPTGFSIGVGVNPGAINLDEELQTAGLEDRGGRRVHDHAARVRHQDPGAVHEEDRACEDPAHLRDLAARLVPERRVHEQRGPRRQRPA